MNYTVDITRAKAVFSDEFQFPGRELGSAVPGYIETDRFVMAARPGMLRKLLPIRIAPDGVFCGGTYAFSTLEEATAYADWCTNEFRLDGKTLFLDRPEFLEPRSQLWEVAGILDSGNVDRQKIMRVERWHTLAPPSLDELKETWLPQLTKAAHEQSVESVWLLRGTDPVHPQLGLVTAYDADTTSATADSSSPALREIESRPSLLSGCEEQYAATKVFDRTSWIYMIWHPIAQGDEAPEATEWPSSPPLPSLQ